MALARPGCLAVGPAASPTAPALQIGDPSGELMACVNVAQLESALGLKLGSDDLHSSALHTGYEVQGERLPWQSFLSSCPGLALRGAVSTLLAEEQTG